MRNRADFWAPVPDWSLATIAGTDVRVAAGGETTSATLASGRLEPFLDRIGRPPLLGPRDRIETATYALRLAPDRVLVVSAEPLALPEGWSADGYAVSALDDGLILIDVIGPAVGDLLSEATSYDLEATESRPRESANIVLAGQRIAVARLAEGWRLHVERPLAAALWRWLETAMADRRRRQSGAPA